ncbi:hypothetical protein [Klenkia sp. PcliD-1-E]|uniref:hypothetical protein n=1 Tax=Klenkia sp. PcliD-1-E TaxID=2954492 RepID=UPI0020979E42|nr:hypothetical protein [Klenkia sp. PcliD-1-E]MCO7219507.1 hypothetical protein [Klenkia sp. PcliD-1-E]
MDFWDTTLGPYFDGDPRGDRTDRAIATVACPDCDGVLGRLLETDAGVGLRAWVPATVPGRPDTRDAGLELWVLIDDERPADDQGTVLNCWKGHNGLWITGALCRELIALYRTRGKPSRRPAGRAPGSQVES